MTDIVERLRIGAVEAFALPIATVMDSAADEIEELRAVRDKKWISVSDQIPEVGVYVLGFEPVCGVMITVQLGNRPDGSIYWFGVTPNGDGEYEDAFLAKAPTYWMPLPELPKGNQ